MACAVFAPMPDSSCKVPAAARSSSSPGGRSSATFAAVRNAFTRYVGSSARSSRNAISRRSATGSRAMSVRLVTRAAWQAEPVRAGLQSDTIRRIEQAIGKLATQSVAWMDEQLPWFRSLPADQRSWVTLVAQAGMRSYVEWLRQPDDVLRLTGEVFATAPRTMARSVTLQQTVELVRQTIAVAEENLPLLASADDRDVVSEELLRFSREIAFAAARVYAIAAERRGSWDARLEDLVIERLISGFSTDVAGNDSLSSQLAALGWHTPGAIGVIAGAAPVDPKQDVRTEIHTLLRRVGVDAMSGIHADRLVVVYGGTADPFVVATTLLPLFGDGPVVVGPTATDP